MARFNPLLSGVVRTPEPSPLPPDLIRLDRNERVGPYPADVRQEILAHLTDGLLTQYPDSTSLYRALSVYTELPRERLLLVPGSDAAFRSLAHIFVEPGDRVAILEPSYQMYPVYTRMFGGEPVPVRVQADLSVDRDELLKATLSSKMLWLANPNQPSGALIPIDEVRSIAKAAVPSGTVVVVDEAYYPFSRATTLPDVTDYDNLVVVRTFSKAFGFAGARLGFVAASPSIIAALFTVRASFDINALAIVAGQWALEHQGAIAAYVDETALSLELLRGVAARYGLYAPPSTANFQLIRTGPRVAPAEVQRRCWNQRYAIAGPAGRGTFEHYIRITGGALHVLREFARTLDGIFESLGLVAERADESSTRKTDP